MYVSDVNKIYERFEKKEISKEEAASLLLGEIFKTPFYYNIGDLDEDQKSEFLIWAHKSTISILEHYQKPCSSFLTYFTVAIRFQTKSWKRLYTKASVKQSVLDDFHMETHKNMIAQEMFVAEQYVPYGESKKPGTYGKSRLSATQRKALLVLALKAYPFLSVEQIEKLPKLIGIDNEKFLGYLNIMHESTQKSKQEYLCMDGKLNNSFMKCKQYKVELENMDSSFSQYLIVNRNLEKQKKLLQNRRNLYNTYVRKTMPKNITIDRTLNLPAGSASKILKRAKENMKQIKEILDLEES